MRKRYSTDQNSQEELNIWPAFTDLMSNSFMILSLFLLLALVKAVYLSSIAQTTKETADQINRELAETKAKVSRLKDELKRVKESSQNSLAVKEQQIATLTTENDRLKSNPVIVIKEAEKRNFTSGRAELSTDLKSYIQDDLVKQIKNNATYYQGYIVAVIGHTDEATTIAPFSNLDTELENVANYQNNNKTPVPTLTPGSNADLGLMRALAVVKELQKQQNLGHLPGKKELKFRAYSAAQLYSVNGEFAPAPKLWERKADQSRRRIEILFIPPPKVEN